MWQRRTSLAELQQQRDVLQAEMDADAQRWVSQLPPDDLVAALMPQARRLQELNQLILRATPPRELMKRLKALERQLLEPGTQTQACGGGWKMNCAICISISAIPAVAH